MTRSFRALVGFVIACVFAVASVAAVAACGEKKPPLQPTPDNELPDADGGTPSAPN